MYVEPTYKTPIALYSRPTLYNENRRKFDFLFKMRVFFECM